jgi:methylated-DNA-[protein]-cysteine S-methyltransferase
MTHHYDTFKTPLGLFTIALNEAGAVTATAFGDRNRLGERLGQCHVIRDTAKTAAAREQVQEYLAGRRQDFNLQLDSTGTPFQKRVWAALLRIPRGKTCSYGELAADLGRPGAARAVGRANATNPICLIVPCHRVIGADGSLTGFAFGEDIKRQLLELEGALLTV